MNEQKFSLQDILLYKELSSNIESFSTFCRTQSPIEGFVDVNLTDNQKTLLAGSSYYPAIIATGPRQSGMTTALCVRLLHDFLFSHDKTIVLISASYDSGRSIIDRVLSMYDNLPDVVKGKLLVRNKRHLESDNGSKILVGSTTNPDSFRGFGINSLYIDNAEYLKKFDEFWHVIYPSFHLSTSRLFAVSTPGFDDNVLNKLTLAFAIRGVKRLNLR